MVVKERVITLYVCEHCQRRYIDMEAAGSCDKRRHRHVDSPGVDILKISSGAYTVLYAVGNIKTIAKLEEQSEKKLLEIKGLGRARVREIMDKLAVYQAGKR